MSTRTTTTIEITSCKYAELRAEYARILPWLDSRRPEVRDATARRLCALAREAARRQASVARKRASALAPATVPDLLDCYNLDFLI